MSLLAQVTLPHKSGLARDQIVNTFTLFGETAASSLTALADDIISFYTATNDASGDATHSLCNWLSPIISRVASQASVRLYDIGGHLDGSPHGSPIFSKLWTVSGASYTTVLPTEVCVAVTMEAVGRAAAPVETPDSADAGTARDRPKERLTGRIYFGPLPVESQSYEGVTGVAKVNPTLAGNLRKSVNAVHDKLKARNPDGGLGVWSRKNAQVVPLANVSTDDAFDIQRRRGERALVRTREAV